MSNENYELDDQTGMTQEELDRHMEGRVVRGMNLESKYDMELHADKTPDEVDRHLKGRIGRSYDFEKHAGMSEEELDVHAKDRISSPVKKSQKGNELTKFEENVLGMFSKVRIKKSQDMKDITEAMKAELKVMENRESYKSLNKKHSGIAERMREANAQSKEQSQSTSLEQSDELEL